jgi:hypothetical protein
MTKSPSLKSLKNCLNDLAERFWSKNRPFVQPERLSERCAKIEPKYMINNNYRLNASAVERLLLEGSVRSER